MLTKHEQKVLKVLAVYNDCTEEQARENIVKAYLAHFTQNAATIFPVWYDTAEETAGPEITIDAGELIHAATIEELKKAEAIVPIEEPKRRGRRPRKPLDKMVEEIHAADKMTKEEFVDYFSGGAR